MADTSLKMTIEEKAIAVDKGDYFGVLGLTVEADGAEIQKAYFILAKTFHPDRLGNADLTPDELKAGRRVFEFMTQAFNVLSDPSKRRSIVSGKNTAAAAGKGAGRTDDTQIFLHQGLKMARMRAWDKAEEFFRKGVHKDGTNVELLCNLGWAIFNNPKKREPVRLEEAKNVWDQALKSDAKDARANYLMSLYYKQVGKDLEQTKHLEAALAADSSMVDAQREMRLLRMRSGKKGKSGSLLAKLFPSFVKK